MPGSLDTRSFTSADLVSISCAKFCVVWTSRSCSVSISSFVYCSCVSGNLISFFLGGVSSAFFCFAFSFIDNLGFGLLLLLFLFPPPNNK